MARLFRWRARNVSCRRPAICRRTSARMRRRRIAGAGAVGCLVGLDWPDRHQGTARCLRRRPLNAIRDKDVSVIPGRDDQAVDPTPALRFAAVARRLGEAARRAGLEVPAFRSPPGLPASRRTIRRLPGGGLMVSVRLRGRRFERVIDDMVEGVLVANRVSARAAPRLRALLRAALPGERQGTGGASAAA